MNIWAIADLHLSLARPERLARIPGRWQDHLARIERSWRGAVRPDDLVLIPGDLSMARNHREVQPDLAWLERLPGTKVLAPGNHDVWWNQIERVRPLLRGSQLAVGGDAIEVAGVIVCGTRGVPPVAADEADGLTDSQRSEQARARRARSGPRDRRGAASRRAAAVRPLALPAL